MSRPSRNGDGNLRDRAQTARIKTSTNESPEFGIEIQNEGWRGDVEVQNRYYVFRISVPRRTKRSVQSVFARVRIRGPHIMNYLSEILSSFAQPFDFRTGAYT